MAVASSTTQQQRTILKCEILSLPRSKPLQRVPTSPREKPQSLRNPARPCSIRSPATIISDRSSRLPVSLQPPGSLHRSLNTPGFLPQAQPHLRGPSSPSSLAPPRLPRACLLYLSTSHTIYLFLHCPLPQLGRRGVVSVLLTALSPASGAAPALVSGPTRGMWGLSGQTLEKTAAREGQVGAVAVEWYPGPAQGARLYRQRGAAARGSGARGRDIAELQGLPPRGPREPRGQEMLKARGRGGPGEGTFRRRLSGEATGPGGDSLREPRGETRDRGARGPAEAPRPGERSGSAGRWGRNSGQRGHGVRRPE